MVSFVFFVFIFVSTIDKSRSEISCTFSNSTKKLRCGEISCFVNSQRTPLGSYRLGTVEWNTAKNQSRVNLYPKKRTGLGYWDYHCKNPDTRQSKLGLHRGSTKHGCIAIPDPVCWGRLERMMKKQQSSTITVTSVQRAGLGSISSFSCDGSLPAGKTILKSVSVIGTLQVTN